MTTWFGNIPNKKSCTFIAFDKALDFASHYIEMTTDERMFIKHTNKTNLYSNKMSRRKIWSDFNVAMGIFNGAGTCKLVGLFLMSHLTHLHVHVGLYVVFCAACAGIAAVKFALSRDAFRKIWHFLLRNSKSSFKSKVILY